MSMRISRETTLTIGIAGVVIAAVLYAALTTPTPPVSCVTPPLLTHHVAPGSTLTYQYVGPWPADAQQCSAAAFDVWSQTLADIPIQFHPQTSGRVADVTVVFTALTPPIAGAITEPTVTATGAVRRGGIVVSSHHPSVSACVGYYKVTLHEIGHLLGLAHPATETAGATVMNNLGSDNDAAAMLPSTPTACDYDAAVASARR